MASFTDQIPQFNPYVQQLPVEAMVAVGMEKQKRYDEGYQKIQASIDAIAGLEVTKDVERAYLQSKLNQLGNDLTTVAAGDFSNYQLVNSVDGMAKQLVYDPNIQTALASTAKRKKEFEFMEEARKKGELTPQNETYFAKRDSAWLNNAELGQGYNAKYDAYFDHFKHAKEVFDAMKIDELTFDEIFQKNADGSYARDRQGNLILSETMTKMKQQGYLHGKLEAAVEQIFNDPRVNQQVTIDAEYNYKNVSSEDLATYVTSQANQMKNIIEDKLDQLYVLLQTDPNNEDIQKEIRISEEAILKIADGLEESGRMISQNPEAVKAMLHKNKLKSNYTSMFNVTKKSSEILQNPQWEAKFKIQKEANEHSRWAQEFAWKKQAHKENLEQKDRHKQQDLEVAKTKALGKGAGESFESGGEGLRQSTELPVEIIAYHDNKVFQAATEFNSAKLDLIWTAIFDTNTDQGKINKERLQKEIAKGFSPEKAKENILRGVAAKKGKKYDDYILELNNTVIEKYSDPKIKLELKTNNKYLADALDNYERTELNYNIENELDKNIKQSNLAEFYKDLEKVEFEDKQIKKDNQFYNLSKQDMIDLAIINKYEGLIRTGKRTPTKEDEALRKLSEGARKRLEVNNKSFLLNDLKKLTQLELKRVNQSIKREGWSTSYELPENEQIEYEKLNRVFSGIGKFESSINTSKLTGQVENTAKAIKQFRNIEPNLIGEVSTGDTGVDNSRLATLRGIVSEYSRNTKPVGQDVKKFLQDVKGATSLEDFRNLSVSRGIEKDATGNLIPFLQSDNGKLYLNTEEARIFGIEPNDVYQNEYVTMIQSRINSQAGTSSIGSVNDYYTYRNNDVAMNNSNFPILNGTNYTVKVNIRQRGNVYYPFIYISNGQKEDIIQSPVTSDNLGKLIMQDLPQFISPTTVEQLLNLKK
jgi:hypothetical protein